MRGSNCGRILVEDVVVSGLVKVMKCIVRSLK
jgi:hypothetical protein